ncbi:DNA cytosine methyltransferase [Vacuolonema iberomarrocanum]|uniref:DNA cytosine methyltransferase n=1 Tax=Vacuolonema iberomarrocanum TaxID=3454632 RepID=UPI001A0B16C8|nr:DNA cytosine methyltransferase [filamentous cyanobacterium LEGE 07170]
MANKATIFSFFSGAGFLDLGFELAGFKIAYVNEIFEPFINAYKYSRLHLNLPEPRYGYYPGSVSDFVTGKQKTTLETLMNTAYQEASLVGFIGGSPCPDFSVGGKNKGKEGIRGNLTSTYIDMICQQRPDFFLLENVAGLWRTRKHYLFYNEIKDRLHQVGYVTTEKLVNAIEYGVPQDRSRIILIGFRKEILPTEKVIFHGNNISYDILFPWKKYILYPQEEIFCLPWESFRSFHEDSIVECPPNILEELTVEYWFKKNDVNNHPNAKHFFHPRKGSKKIGAIKEGDTSRKSFKRLHRWRYSPTVCYGNNEVHLHPYKKRRVSVAEALALQSLPRDFVLPEYLSITNMFKTVGNGVPFLVAYSLALCILDFLDLEK